MKSNAIAQNIQVYSKSVDGDGYRQKHLRIERAIYDTVDLKKPLTEDSLFIYFSFLNRILKKV